MRPVGQSSGHEEQYIPHPIYSEKCGQGNAWDIKVLLTHVEKLASSKAQTDSAGTLHHLQSPHQPGPVPLAVTASLRLPALIDLRFLYCKNSRLPHPPSLPLISTPSPRTGRPFCVKARCTTELVPQNAWNSLPDTVQLYSCQGPSHSCQSHPWLSTCVGHPPDACLPLDGQTYHSAHLG